MTARAPYRELSRLLAGGGRRPRIGLLGGSFNPAHAGHRAISLRALKRLRLDAVWWLVSPQNPLKSDTDMAPLSDRMAFARRLARHRRIRVTDIEQTLATRYSIDTVRALQQRLPHARFVWLMGADNLLQISQWHDWQELFKAVPIAIFDRPSYALRALFSLAACRYAVFRWPTRGADRLVVASPPAWVYARAGSYRDSATDIRASGAWPVPGGAKEIEKGNKR